jgi:protein-S-isoprenylcysteine O-methyltransferase Ste14
MDVEKKKIWWVKNIISIIFLSITLFLSSGKFNWVMAWLYIMIGLVIIIANAMAMAPSLLAERSQIQEGTKDWDVTLVIFVSMLGPFLIWLTAGLDIRFGWSQGMLLELQIAALVLVLLGGLLGTWSMASNQYFSATVRIQSERNHKVVTRGPYQYIRHPGYMGGIISMLMTPIALGSWVTLIPGISVVFGYIIRTGLEDEVLQEELEGYKEYTKKVRYRLVPGIW